MSAAIAHHPVRQDDRKSLYIASGAMFAGLVGVSLFAAPGGLLGAVLGALAGAAVAQVRLKRGS